MLHFLSISCCRCLCLVLSNLLSTFFSIFKCLLLRVSLSITSSPFFFHFVCYFLFLFYPLELCKAATCLSFTILDVELLDLGFNITITIHHISCGIFKAHDKPVPSFSSYCCRKDEKQPACSATTGQDLK